MEQQTLRRVIVAFTFMAPPEERNIGKAASFGCIRMRSRDIMALYDWVHVGMHVTVSEKPLEELVPGEKPTLLSRAD